MRLLSSLLRGWEGGLDGIVPALVLAALVVAAIAWWQARHDGEP